MKAIMDLDLSSCSLKKVLLLGDFGRQARTARDDIEILIVASSHPYLNPTFQNKVFKHHDYRGKEQLFHIDFPRWQRKMANYWSKSKGERERQF